MKLTIIDNEKNNKFINLFQSLKNLTDVLQLQFSSSGISAQGIDKSQCCLFEFNIDKSWFSSYEYDSNDEPMVGLSLVFFAKIMSTRRDTQAIEMSYTGSPDTLNIIFTSNTKDEYSKSYDLSLIEVSIDKLVIPDIDYDADVVIKTNMIKEMIDELSLFSDRINISLDEEHVKFKSSGDNGSMSIEVKDDDLIEYSIVQGEKLDQKYNAKYIKIMCGFNRLKDEVKLCFSNEHPLKIHYNISNKDNDGSVKIYLAPYIDE